MPHKRTTKELTLIFDPGALTGIALLDDKGAILRTEAFTPSETLEFARRYAVKREHFTPKEAMAIVIESGPQWQQHSPITRSVTEKLKVLFPDAHLVPPNQWKGHPAAKCAERVSTRHERDAVRLGRCFMARRHNEQDPQVGKVGRANTS